MKELSFQELKVQSRSPLWILEPMLGLHSVSLDVTRVFYLHFNLCPVKPSQTYGSLSAGPDSSRQSTRLRVEGQFLRPNSTVVVEDKHLSHDLLSS